MPPLNPLAARVFVALALAAAAAAADEPLEPAPQALFTRPITLPRATGELTVLGDLTNTSADYTSNTGGVLAIGVELGVTSRLQLGVAAAFGSAPSYGPGDLIATGDYALTRAIAVRVDGGYEKREGAYFGLAGLGVPLRLPLGGDLAFVSGDTSAVRFAHFVDFGLSNSADNYGGTFFTATHADLVTVLAGSTGTEVGLHLPLGILWQPNPVIALQLSTGYALQLDTASGAGTSATHYLPVGLDAIFSPDPQFDLGLSFSFAGTLHSSDAANGDTFANTRLAAAWLRFRAANLF